MFIVVNVKNKTRALAGILERMMGLEPTTFCMANRPSLVIFADIPCIFAFLGSLS
jgi:hypothetical protein